MLFSDFKFEITAFIKEETIVSYRTKLELKEKTITQLEDKIKNIPTSTKLRFENQKAVKGGVGTKELESKIMAQNTLILSYRSEMEKQQKDFDQTIRLNKWNEKKLNEAKIKLRV